MRFTCLRNWIFIAALLAAANLPAQDAGHYFPLWQKQSPNITDLALIYQGGTMRPQWTLDRFAPYVSYRDQRTGKEQWLFDGFLMIEFEDGKQHTYQPNSRREPARKEHWLALLEKNFANDDGIANLEKSCRQTAVRIGQPLRRRQLIITLPEPIQGQTNWGSLGGRALNFRKAEDRLAAIEWFLDAAAQKWNDLAPQQLDLAGFYWVHEGTPKSNEFFKQAAKLIHSRGKLLFWIPYWQPGSPLGDWRKMGIDAAWQQPNHFFHPEIPDARLQQACDFAKQHGLGLEFECDGRMISDRSRFERRFDAYLDAFIKNDVKNSASIAYYEGGGALFQLANSSEPQMKAHYERIAQFVLDRQLLADKLAAASK